MQPARSMIRMSRKADFGVEVTSDFFTFPVRIVVVKGADGSGAVDEFPDAAEVVFRVVVESRVAAADPLLALGEVAFGYGGAVGFAFFGGLVAAGPEVAFVAGDGVAGVALGDADAAGEAVVGELGFAVVRVGDFHEAVLRVPKIRLTQAVCGHVPVQIVGGDAALAGDVDAPGLGAGVGVGELSLASTVRVLAPGAACTQAENSFAEVAAALVKGLAFDFTLDRGGGGFVEMRHMPPFRLQSQ